MITMIMHDDDHSGVASFVEVRQWLLFLRGIEGRLLQETNEGSI
jgi:hypothetical protein